MKTLKELNMPEYEDILKIRINKLKQKLLSYKPFRLHEFLAAYDNVTNFTVSMHRNSTALIDSLSNFLSTNTVHALDRTSMKDDDFKLEAINQALLNDKKKLINKE